MSEEQVIQNETKSNKVCKCTVALVLAGLALVLSISALIYSVLITNGTVTIAGVEKKIIISQQYDKGKSVAKALKRKKPMIVFFYTDWCGYCQRFVSTFDKVSKNSQIKKNFAIAYVNCEDSENSDYVSEYEIKAFPTVYVIDGEKRTRLENNTFFKNDSVEIIVKDSLKAIGKGE